LDIVSFAAVQQADTSGTDRAWEYRKVSGCLIAKPTERLGFVTNRTAGKPDEWRRTNRHPAHESRTDFAMFLGLLFLLIVGAGAWSIDARFSGKQSANAAKKQ
jgi:hypothetical protein